LCARTPDTANGRFGELRARATGLPGGSVGHLGWPPAGTARCTRARGTRYSHGQFSVVSRVILCTRHRGGAWLMRCEQAALVATGGRLAVPAVPERGMCSSTSLRGDGAGCHRAAAYPKTVSDERRKSRDGRDACRGGSNCEEQFRHRDTTAPRQATRSDPADRPTGRTMSMSTTRTAATTDPSQTRVPR
jgi:hypothetical protein